MPFLWRNAQNQRWSSVLGGKSSLITAFAISQEAVAYWGGGGQKGGIFLEKLGQKVFVLSQSKKHYCELKLELKVS